MKEIAQAEQQSNAHKTQLAQTDRNIESLQNQLVEISAEAEKWEGRRLLSLEKQKNSEQQVKRIRQELTDAQKEKKDLATKLAAAKEKMAITGSSLEKINSEMNEIAQILKRSVKETEAEIDELKSSYIEMLNEEATIRNDLKHIEERMQGEKTSTVRISEQTSVLKGKLR